jgi:hypothetical protein
MASLNSPIFIIKIMYIHDWLSFAAQIRPSILRSPAMRAGACQAVPIEMVDKAASCRLPKAQRAKMAISQWSLRILGASRLALFVFGAQTERLLVLPPFLFPLNSVR